MPGTEPLQPEAVVDRLLSLPVLASQRGAAALHLLTPVDSVVGIHVSIGETDWTWRGVRRSAPRSLDSAALCRAAADLVREAWRPSDTPVNLTGACLKPVRSGAHILIGGTFLYNGPEILVGVNVEHPSRVAAAWLSKYERGVDVAGVIELDGEPYLIQGDDRVVRISGTTGPVEVPVASGEYDSSMVRSFIQSSLRLSTVEPATIGSRAVHTTDVDYVGSIDDRGERYDVIIPATIGRGMSVGAPHGVAVPAVSDWYGVENGAPWYGIAGFEPVERALLEPGWVARHSESGIYVLIRPSSSY